MKKLNLTITPGELPPSPESVEGLRSALSSLKVKVSAICTASMGLTLVGFIGLQWVPVKTALGDTLSGLAFVAGLLGFLVGREYEKVIGRRLAEASPIPDSLLAEAAALGKASPAAQAYLDGLRAQKREMTLAEMNALKKLLAATPTEVAREALYG